MYSDPATLDDVRFLVRSPNRLVVFDAIRTGPRERNELRGVTDSSRVTLARILGDLEERGWIARGEDGYRSTPAGTVVAEEVARLFSNVEAAAALDGTLGWLPTDRFDFELSRLGDATVITPTDRDLTRPITWTARRVRESRDVRNVATGISAEVVDAYLDAAEEPDRSLVTVMHGRVFGLVEDDADLRGKVREMLDADAIDVYRYDGEQPPVMSTVCDDLVVLCGRPDPRSTPEGVETDDDAVREWAVSYFESVRAEADPVESDPFGE
ncbi:MAG TPA: hypothetical protein VKA37_13395 [Halobacteriales archaeon]|nr:hypothetical protein [Halobacteriales archaeon]